MNQSTDQTTSTSRFIEPLDVLIFRGNTLFGAAGSFGESMMPPWPSVAAGAIRSRILADDHVDLRKFAKGTVIHPTLGSPQAPGSFTLQAFQLARRRKTDDTPELMFPLPADMIVTADVFDATKAGRIRILRPTTPPPGVATSARLPLLAILAQGARDKPATGWWLREAGWAKYLRSVTPDPQDLEHSSNLWRYDERVGIGLDAVQGSASDGRLFTVRAIAPFVGVGFAINVSGATVPADGMLRLGGDGRGTCLRPANISWPQPDYESIAAAGRCRIILTSPTLSRQGWLPPGTDANLQIRLPGVSARVVCAATGRTETVSGWDLARRQPKPACMAIGTGSVYWLDDMETTPDALRKLASVGLWSDPCEDPARRAEGFNRFSFAPF